MWKSLFGGKKSGPAVGGNKELLTLSVTVETDAEAAFARFVDKLDTWWPRDFTLSGDALSEIGIEPRRNGACYELKRDGSRLIWGTVLAYDRPGHLVLAWQIGPDRTAVENEALASRVDVRFSANEDGGANVLVVHRDFPRHGEGWEKYRGEMAGAKGWPHLIQNYQAAFAAE